MLTLSWRSLAFTFYKAFLKNKKGFGTSLPASLSALYSKKNIFLYSITWPNFIFWLLLIHDIFSNMVIVIVNQTVTLKFWNLLYRSNQAIFSTWSKSQHKNLIILRTKRAFMVKLKAFFIIFNGLSLKRTKHFFGRWGPDFKTSFLGKFRWFFSVFPIWIPQLWLWRHQNIYWILIKWMLTEMESKYIHVKMPNDLKPYSGQVFWKNP